MDIFLSLLFLASTGVLLVSYQRLLLWYKIWQLSRKINQAVAGSKKFNLPFQNLRKF